MKKTLGVAGLVAVLLATSAATASDEKAARKSPSAQRAKNMSELYMESMPGTLPGGVPVVQQPVNPMGGGTPGADRPDAPAADPTPSQPTPAPGPSPEPQPDPTPVGEAPPPPAPPAPPAPPSYGGCP